MKYNLKSGWNILQKGKHEVTIFIYPPQSRPPSVGLILIFGKISQGKNQYFETPNYQSNFKQEFQLPF